MSGGVWATCTGCKQPSMRAHTVEDCVAALGRKMQELSERFARHVVECHSQDDDVVDGHICGGEWRPFPQEKCGVCGDGPVQTPAAAPVQASGDASGPSDADGSFYMARVDFECAVQRAARGAVASRSQSEADDLNVKRSRLHDLFARVERERDEARALAEAYQRAVFKSGDVADTHTASPADVLTIARRRDEARAELAKARAELAKIPAAAADVPTQCVSGRDEPGGGVCADCEGKGYVYSHEVSGKPERGPCPACRGAR